MKILYQLLCITAALGMTTFCIVKYLKNKSVVSVNYKQFQDPPTDVYPSISICFRKPFIKTNNTEDAKVEEMMKGERKFNKSLMENVTYDDMTVKLDVNQIEYYKLDNDLNSKINCTQSDCFKTIGDANMKCYTHDIKSEGNSTVMKVGMILDNAKSTLADYFMRIYLQYHGQFFRNSLQHVLTSKPSPPSIRSLMTLNIQFLTVLQRREDDKTSCNPASSEDDEMILKNTAKMFNCSSKYPG